MSDTFVTIIAIGLAAVLMFVFPLITMADRTDDVSQLTVETATTEFVDEIRTTGKITADKFGKFQEAIGSTGNTYNVEMEARILDENPGKKTTQAAKDKIGENTYYSVYTSQIEEKLKPKTEGGEEEFRLKEGDIISVSVKNSNQTLSQQLKNFFYKVTGNSTYTIAASHGGIVTATGK